MKRIGQRERYVLTDMELMPIIGALDVQFTILQIRLFLKFVGDETRDQRIQDLIGNIIF